MDSKLVVVSAVTWLFLHAKLKLDEYGHALKAASDATSCFVDMFLHFSKNANYVITSGLSLTEATGNIFSEKCC